MFKLLCSSNYMFSYIFKQMKNINFNSNKNFIIYYNFFFQYQY